MHFKTLSTVWFLTAFPFATYALTQTEATARCQVKYPNYTAVQDSAGKYRCISPTPPDEDVCFELEYKDPKTNKDGCCPVGSPFSFDPVSKEGRCCPEGSKYSWDAIAMKGDCCGGVSGVECEFKCSCQVKPKAGEAGKPSACTAGAPKKEDPTPPGPSGPTCPSGNGQTWTTGRKTYKLSCGKMVGGKSIKPCEPQPDLASCATKCSSVDGCKSVDYYNFSCCYKTQSTLPTYENAVIDNWTEVPSDSPAPSPSPSPTPPTCPTGNGKTWKAGGKTYKLYCGKMVGGTSIGDCDPQPDSPTCATKCASVAGCKSVDWFNKSCCYKTQSTPPVYDYATIDNWLEVPDEDTPAPPATPSCPSGNGQTYKAGGKSYKLSCGKMVGGKSIVPCEPQPDLPTCATKCATISGCKSVDWYQKSCCYKTQATAPTYNNAVIDNWVEV